MVILQLHGLPPPADNRVLLVSAVTDLQLEQFARGNPTVRLPSPEVVQAARTGQGWHCALVKRATMSGAVPGAERSAQIGGFAFVLESPCMPIYLGSGSV